MCIIPFPGYLKVSVRRQRCAMRGHYYTFPGFQSTVDPFRSAVGAGRTAGGSVEFNGPTV
jgi:hypothetical protein